MVLAAAPAHARPSDLRDPFRPLLSNETDGAPSGGDPTGTDPAGEDPTGDDPTGGVDPDPVPPDGLPTTGSDTTEWLAGAYALIAVGAGLVMLDRVARPRRRRLGT